jgi:hypothetical protein
VMSRTSGRGGVGDHQGGLPADPALHRLEHPGAVGPQQLQGEPVDRTPGLRPEQGRQVRLPDGGYGIAPDGGSVNRDPVDRQDAPLHRPARRRKGGRDEGQRRGVDVQDGIQLRADVAAEGRVDLLVDGRHAGALEGLRGHLGPVGGHRRRLAAAVGAEHQDVGPPTQGGQVVQVEGHDRPGAEARELDPRVVGAREVIRDDTQLDRHGPSVRKRGDAVPLRGRTLRAVTRSG